MSDVDVTPTGLGILPVKRDIPIGAKTFTMQIVAPSGRREFTRPVCDAREMTPDEVNRRIWYGDDQTWGVTNYPYLVKSTVAVPFNGTASPHAVMASMERQFLSVGVPIVTRAGRTYGSPRGSAEYAPDAVVVTPVTDRFLRTMMLPEGSVLDVFLNRHNVKYSVAWELAGIGPGGTDGMFWYRDDPDAVAIVIVGDPMVGFGGVIMPLIEHNLLCWVNADDWASRP